MANSTIEKLEDVVAARGCLTELREVADRLDRQGFVGRPGWGELKLGARPPPAHTVEPGEWAHGWQYHASSASEYNFRETVVLPQSSASPGPPSFSLWRRILKRALRMPHKPRIHSGGRAVSHFGSGKVEVAFSCDRRQVRMRGLGRQQGVAQSSLPTLRTIAHKGSGTGENSGQSLARSWSQTGVVANWLKGCQEDFDKVFKYVASVEKVCRKSAEKASNNSRRNVA